MTPSELKTKVEAVGGKFFTPATMHLFGDTMRNRAAELNAAAAEQYRAAMLA